MFTTLRLRLKGLIDSRNISLWKEINQSYEIEVLKSTNDEYNVYSINNSSTIRYVSNNICSDSFTHELLHIDLRLKGCFIGAAIKLHMPSNGELVEIMSFELLEHIGNCLDHVRMLPIYLDMGYDRKKFIKDYNTRKVGQEFIVFLTANYREYGSIDKQNADIFIGKLFAILADPNDSFDYSADLEMLRNIDPVLFDINKRLFDAWLETPLDEYHSLVFDYYEELLVWETSNLFRA